MLLNIPDRIQQLYDYVNIINCNTFYYRIIAHRFAFKYTLQKRWRFVPIWCRGSADMQVKCEHFRWFSNCKSCGMNAICEKIKWKLNFEWMWHCIVWCAPLDPHIRFRKHITGYTQRHDNSVYAHTAHIVFVGPFHIHAAVRVSTEYCI